MSVLLLEELTEEMAPRVLPPGWRRLSDPGNKWLTNDGLSVICSAEQVDDRRWWHVSFARQNRMPSWEDLRKVKDVFVGKSRTAIQVLPSEDKYVNYHPYCLHLWSCLDADGLPDFRRLGVL